VLYVQVSMPDKRLDKQLKHKIPKSVYFDQDLLVLILEFQKKHRGSFSDCVNALGARAIEALEEAK
jgi:hypothetical protein